MNITFLGAAGEVTGSCYLIDTGDSRFLVDCGLFQGGREARAKNLAALRLDVRSLDFVLLTHAHIDHSGMLPRLVALGYQGPIYTTAATRDLLGIMLPDSAHLQESEAEWENRRRHRSWISKRSGQGDLAPLYTVQQALSTLKHLRPVEYGERIWPKNGVAIEFVDAGHILGSAIVQVWIEAGGARRKLVFSGDLGQPGRPLMIDPTPIADADVLLVESTYGNRNHRSLQDTENELVEVVRHTLESGGNVVVPAFAVGRTQEILYMLIDLVRRDRLPHLNVFVDSPMATAATQLTYRHDDDLDAEAQRALTWFRNHPKRLNIRFTADVEESKQINQIKGGAIIVTASGMCDAGRIKHHLFNNLPRGQCAILITGFQAAGTLGRKLVDGAKNVRLFGEAVPVRASIHTLGGLSAHADCDGLLGWLRRFDKAPARIFVVHGEYETSKQFADTIRNELGWRQVVVPQAGEVFEF